MKLDSNFGEQRMPMVVLCLAGAVAGAPFFLLAFALSPLNETWLEFVVATLPLTAIVALWLWVRRPNSGGSNVSMGVPAQEAYSRM